MRTTVTKEYLENRIKDVSYHVLPGTTITTCVLVMANGYKVLGKSACVDPDNFSAATGRKYAYEDALNEAWPLEGYLLAEELSRAKTQEPTGNPVLPMKTPGFGGPLKYPPGVRGGLIGPGLHGFHPTDASGQDWCRVTTE